MSLDPTQQLLAGLRAAVQAATGLGAAVLTQWPEPDLVGRLGAQPNGLNPLVVVTLGDTSLARPQPAPSTSAKTTWGPADSAGRVVLYSASARLQTPVQLLVMAAGLTGKTVCGRVGEQIVTALGPGLRPDGTPRSSILLPDSAEAAIGFDGTGATLGLTAQVTYGGERWDDRHDARQIYSHTLLYQAIHARYTTSQETLVGDVGVSVITPAAY